MALTKGSAAGRSQYISMSIHPWDSVPGVRSSHLLDGAFLGAFSVSFVSLSHSPARVSWGPVPSKLLALKSLSEVYFWGIKT